MPQFDALVTGGTGFIGRHLVKHLCALGKQVVATTRNPQSWEDPPKKSKLISWDVLEPAPALPRCAVWYHLAANTNVRFCNAHPDQADFINATSLASVMSEAELSGCEKFVLVSTLGVYGDPQYLPVDEAHPKSPIEAYATSKAKAEDNLFSYRGQQKIKRIIIRPFNTFGPGQNAAMLVPSLVAQVQKSHTITLRNLDHTRDFVFVEDVVRGMALAGDLAQDGDILNLGSGIETSIDTLVQTLGHVLERQLTVNLLPETGTFQAVRRSQADITKAREILNWSPLTSLTDGLRQVVDLKTP